MTISIEVRVPNDVDCQVIETYPSTEFAHEYFIHTLVRAGQTATFTVYGLKQILFKEVPKDSQ